MPEPTLYLINTSVLGLLIDPDRWQGLERDGNLSSWFTATLLGAALIAAPFILWTPAKRAWAKLKTIQLVNGDDDEAGRATPAQKGSDR